MSQPVITRRGFLGMQVCVPKEWTDQQAEDFANTENPTGIASRWFMRHDGDESLSGAAERVACSSRPDCVHISFDC